MKKIVASLLSLVMLLAGYGMCFVSTPLSAPRIEVESVQLNAQNAKDLQIEEVIRPLKAAGVMDEGTIVGLLAGGVSLGGCVAAASLAVSIAGAVAMCPYVALPAFIVAAISAVGSTGCGLAAFIGLLLRF